MAKKATVLPADLRILLQQTIKENVMATISTLCWDYDIITPEIEAEIVTAIDKLSLFVLVPGKPVTGNPK